MLPTDQIRFPPKSVTLRDGRTVTLRFLTPDDAEVLGDFYESIERAAYRFYCPHGLTRENAAKKAADAESATSVTLVAEHTAGAIVGYNWYAWKVGSEEPSIFGICIRKEHRGNALGRALMARLLEVAAEIGPEVMSLTVQKANPRAAALYTKMGFQPVREQMRGQVEEFPAEPETYMERRAR